MRTYFLPLWQVFLLHYSTRCPACSSCKCLWTVWWTWRPCVPSAACSLSTPHQASRGRTQSVGTCPTCWSHKYRYRGRFLHISSELIAFNTHWNGNIYICMCNVKGTFKIKIKNKQTFESVPWERLLCERSKKIQPQILGMAPTLFLFPKLL